METLQVCSNEHAHDRIVNAIVEQRPNELSLALFLQVTEDDREIAKQCAERHEHNNRRFAHQAKFYRGKNHFATIVRGYLGEIIIRKHLNLPHSIDDLVFDKPQKRPDLLEVFGYSIRLDMKTTEDGTARVNYEAHHSEVKRPFAYLIADVRGEYCYVYIADADSVDGWDLKSFPSQHYFKKMPEPVAIH